MTYTYVPRNDNKHVFTCLFTRDCFFWYYVSRSYLANVSQSVQTLLNTLVASAKRPESTGTNHHKEVAS